MCKHYDSAGCGVCGWESYYNEHIASGRNNAANSGLPVDENGLCLFHSSDIEWKRQNKFAERLATLITCVDNDEDMEDISFDDFILVGNDTLDRETWEKHDYKLDSPNEHILYLHGATCRKNLVFHNARFHDPVIIEKGIFKTDLIIDHCLFEESISIDRLTIGADLYIDGSEFKRHFVWVGKNRVIGNFTIIDSKFNGRTDFCNLVLENHSVVDNNVFEKSDFVSEFNCRFDGGLDFTRNEFADLRFDACYFYGDCTFAELTQHHSFTIINPTIQGQVSFVGTAEHLLFNANTRIYLTDDCFEELGHVTFDYCNVKDLGTAFVDNIKTLEDLELVRISPTCQVERLTIIYEYHPYTSLNANIIEDFAHLVARYFSRWHAVNLTVKIDRNKCKRTIRVVFKTTDDISDEEFRKIMNRFSMTIQASRNSTNDEILDIIDTYRSICDRLRKRHNIIGYEKIAEILSMQGAIQIGTININSNTMKINNSQIGILSTGNNANFDNNTIVQNASSEPDYRALSDELNGLIRIIRREQNDCEEVVYLLHNAIDAAEQRDDSQLARILSNLPRWVLKAANGVGIGVLSSYIAQVLGI